MKFLMKNFLNLITPLIRVRKGIILPIRNFLTIFNKYLYYITNKNKKVSQFNRFNFIFIFFTLLHFQFLNIYTNYKQYFIIKNNIKFLYYNFSIIDFQIEYNDITYLYI